MGERTEFRPGERATLDGQYIEIGENGPHRNIVNPRTVTLQAGDEFPKTSNHNRKWTRKTVH